MPQTRKTKMVGGNGFKVGEVGKGGGEEEGGGGSVWCCCSSPKMGRDPLLLGDQKKAPALVHSPLLGTFSLGETGELAWLGTPETVQGYIDPCSVKFSNILENWSAFL